MNQAFDNLSKEEKETLTGLQEQLKKAMRAKLRAENQLNSYSSKENKLEEIIA